MYGKRSNITTAYGPPQPRNDDWGRSFINYGLRNALPLHHNNVTRSEMCQYMHRTDVPIQHSKPMWSPPFSSTLRYYSPRTTSMNSFRHLTSPLSRFSCPLVSLACNLQFHSKPGPLRLIQCHGHRNVSFRPLLCHRDSYTW